MWSDEIQNTSALGESVSLILCGVSSSIWGPNKSAGSDFSSYQLQEIADISLNSWSDILTQLSCQSVSLGPVFSCNLIRIKELSEGIRPFWGKFDMWIM